MVAARFIASAYFLAAILMVAGCGGGGGGDLPPVVQGLRIDSIEVETQPTGPDSPFGTTAGGDRVVLRGQGFVLGLTLTFDSVEATIDEVSANRVVATTPTHAAGYARVGVRNPNGATAFLDETFQFIAPPRILDVEILSGPTAGGAAVPIAGGETLEVTGREFRDGIRIAIDGKDSPTTFVDASTARVMEAMANSSCCSRPSTWAARSRSR